MPQIVVQMRQKLRTVRRCVLSPTTSLRGPDPIGFTRRRYRQTGRPHIHVQLRKCELVNRRQRQSRDRRGLAPQPECHLNAAAGMG